MSTHKLQELSAEQIHLRDSQVLRKELLERFDVRPRVLAPTRDGAGNVRLTFAELRTIMGDSGEGTS